MTSSPFDTLCARQLGGESAPRWPGASGACWWPTVIRLQVFCSHRVQGYARGFATGIKVHNAKSAHMSPVLRQGEEGIPCSTTTRRRPQVRPSSLPGWDRCGCYRAMKSCKQQLSGREISSAEESTSTSDGLVVMTASSTKAKATQSTWCPSIPRPRRPDNRMTQLQSPTTHTAGNGNGQRTGDRTVVTKTRSACW